MRAIDADAFKDYIRGACEDMKHMFKDNGAWAKVITESFCKDIDEQPTIQPEPHIGCWVPVGVAEVVGGESAMWGSAIAYHVCSKCFEQAMERDGEEVLSNFCPNCGADMREVTT